MQLAQVPKLTIDKVIQGQLPAVRSSTLCLHQSPNRPQAAKLWRVTNLSLNRAIPSLGRLDQTHQGVDFGIMSKKNVSPRQGDAFIDFSVVHRYRNVCSWTTGLQATGGKCSGKQQTRNSRMGTKRSDILFLTCSIFFMFFPYCFERLGTWLSLKSNLQWLLVCMAYRLVIKYRFSKCSRHDQYEKHFCWLLNMCREALNDVMALVAVAWGRRMYIEPAITPCAQGALRNPMQRTQLKSET